MNFSKQSALGIVMLLGGSIMLYTTFSSDKYDSPEQAQIENGDDKQDVTLTVAGAEKLTVEPLTTDIKTETDILEKKQQEREVLVKEQEDKAKKFVAEQEKAANSAISKTKEENKQFKDAKLKAEKFKSEVDEKGVSRPLVANRQTESGGKQPNTTDKSLTKSLAQGSTTYSVAAGEGLIKIAKDHNVPIETLAEANDMYFLDGLMYNQKLIIPSATQVAKLEKSSKANQKKRAVAFKAKLAKQAEKVRAEQAKLAKIRLKEKAEREKIALRAKKKADEQKAKRKAEQKIAAKKTADEQQAKRKEEQKIAAKKTLEKKRQQERAKKAEQKPVPKTKITKKEPVQKKATQKDDKALRGTFGIQVTLAGNQKSADAVAARLRKAGYKTKTSQTDRGVRVMVGPVKGKTAALKLKDEINSNSKTGVKNAWVLFWR